MSEDDDDIDVEEGVPSKESFLRNVTVEKERGASWVARGLIFIFGGAIVVCLTGGFVLIGFHPPASTVDNKANIITDAVLPLLQSVSTLAATVFSPLLAFILGYYFGEKKQEKVT